jgi:hypothetical protein
VREWAGAEEEPNERYRRAFVWYDEDKPENFTSYKFPIADVIGGDLKAVPHAIFNAAAVVDGARGGAEIPQSDIPAVKEHLARYYEKLGESPPWEDR